MFKIGDRVQFKDKKKKGSKVNAIKGIFDLLGLPEDIISVEGIVVDNFKNKTEVSFPPLFPWEQNRRTFTVPTELLKSFELESNHPITKVFL